MKFKIPKKIIYSVIALCYVVLGITSIFSKDVGLIFAVGFGTIVLFVTIAYAYVGIMKAIHRGFDINYKQIESLQNILSVIHPRLPLPSMGGWTILPDSSVIIVRTILAQKPKLIFECGSGISTLLSAYALEKNGSGKIISIDHEEPYAEMTRKNMIAHGFESHSHHVLHAPLVQQSGEKGLYIWYSGDFLKAVDAPIDLLIIDGPPHKTQKNARYPAMPILYARLAPDAVIILDDASREDERNIVQQWINEFKLKLEFHDTQKGVAVLKKI